MATTSVNPVEEEQKGKSSLETFATAMGILSQLGSLGVQGYGALNPQPSEMDKFLQVMKMQKGGGGGFDWNNPANSRNLIP